MARRTEEERLVDAIAKTVNDPLVFVEFAFPWGEGDLKNFPDGPDQWQRDLFKEMATHCRENMERRRKGERMVPFKASVKSGHGIGKSACLSWLILWLMSTREDCRGVVTANTASQLETKTWPELSKWHRMAINSHWFKWTATKFYQVDSPETWKFDCVPWSEERTEAFAGLHNADSSAVMIFDEASAIPDGIWEVAEGAMTDGEPFWFVFGNPTKNTGRFFECFNRFRNRWFHVTVDSRTCRITNKRQLQEWIDDYGIDSDFVKVRILGQFPDQGDGQFIDSARISAAMERVAEEDRNAGYVMGVDIARYGDDESVIVLREGRSLHKNLIWKYKDKDLMTLASLVGEKINQYKPDQVFVDETGLGAGVVDRLKQLGFRVIGVNFGSAPEDKKLYVNKRVEMWGRMKEWLLGASIPNDDNLFAELRSPEYGFDSLNRFRLETKEEMRSRGLASPDIADALALTFAYKVVGNDVIRASRQRKGGQRFADSEYEVFS